MASCLQGRPGGSRACGFSFPLEFDLDRGFIRVLLVLSSPQKPGVVIFGSSLEFSYQDLLSTCDISVAT